VDESARTFLDVELILNKNGKGNATALTYLLTRTDGTTNVYYL
jgi:hypothetical protein